MLQAYFQETFPLKFKRRFILLDKRHLREYECHDKQNLLRQTYLTIEWSLEASQKYNEQKFAFNIVLSHQDEKIELITSSQAIFQIWKKKLSTIVPENNLMKNIKKIRKIGSGNFSDVFCVTDYGKKFALKAIEKQKKGKQRQKILRSLQNEIDIMNAVDSPNIIKLCSISVDEKSFYMKMPFYEGSTLAYLIKQKALTQKDIKKLMKDILYALIELKKHRIVHRDIKPDNILMRQIDGVRQYALIDFGLATYQKVDEYIYFRCGTPGYVAPEIANMVSKEERMTVASDIFSLGCVFYLMLCKKSLFPGKNVQSILYRNRKCLLNLNSLQFCKLRNFERDLLVKMLQRRPRFRITPEQALVHDYFTKNETEQSEQQSIPDQQNDILKKMTNLNKKIVKKNRNTILLLDSLSQTGQSQNSRMSGESQFLTFENVELKSNKNGRTKSISQNKNHSSYKKSSFLEQKKEQVLLHKNRRQTMI